MPESELSRGVWGAKLPFLSTLFICVNWLLFLINGRMNSSEARWRGKWTTETGSRLEEKEEVSLEWWQTTRALLHRHAPWRDLAYFLQNAASALLDREENSAVKI